MAPAIIVAIYLLLGAADAAHAFTRGTPWPLAAVTPLCRPFLLPAPKGVAPTTCPDPTPTLGGSLHRSPRWVRTTWRPCWRGSARWPRSTATPAA